MHGSWLNSVYLNTTFCLGTFSSIWNFQVYDWNNIRLFIEFDLFLGTPTRFYRRQEGQVTASSSFRQNSENVLNPASLFPRKAEKRAHNFCSDSSKRSDLQNMRTRPLQVRNVTPSLPPLFTSRTSAFCFTNKLEARLFA